MTANIESTPIFDQTKAWSIKMTKPLKETPAQRRRRQKKAKHKAAKLFRGLTGQLGGQTP